MPKPMSWLIVLVLSALTLQGFVLSTSGHSEYSPRALMRHASEGVRWHGLVPRKVWERRK